MLILGCHTKAKSSLIGSLAYNYTSTQILLQNFKAIVFTVGEVGKHITTFQKALQHAVSPYEYFCHTECIYAAIMNIHIGKIHDYYNILIAPSTVNHGMQVDMNVIRVKKKKTQATHTEVHSHHTQ